MKHKQQRLNRKGAITDSILFIVFAFTLAIVSVLFVFVGDKLLTGLQDNAPSIQTALGDAGNATQIINATFGAVPRALASMQWITTMLIVGLMLSIFISSFMVKTRPVFIVIHILVTILAIIIAVPISNTYETLESNPTLAPYFTGFLAQGVIFENLPIWVAVVGIMSGVLMAINISRATEYLGGGY